MNFSKVGIVFNPVGGSFKPQRLAELRSAFSRRRALVTCYPTKPEPTPATRQAMQAAADGNELIVAMGGDGTVREVAQAALDTGILMAAYQGGTSNVFAESFYSTLKPARFVDMLFAGIPQMIDLIEVEYEADGTTKHRKEICLTGLCTGSIGKAITSTPRTLKRIFGPLAYAARVSAALLQQRKDRLTFKSERAAWQANVSTVVVLNVVTSTFTKISRGCNASDGLMDVVLFKTDRILDVPGIVIRLITGHPDRSRHYVRHRIRELEMSSAQPFDINLDGEPVRTKSIKLTVRPQALPIIVA